MKGELLWKRLIQDLDRGRNWKFPTHDIEKPFLSFPSGLESRRILSSRCSFVSSMWSCQYPVALALVSEYFGTTVNILTIYKTTNSIWNKIAPFLSNWIHPWELCNDVGHWRTVYWITNSKTNQYIHETIFTGYRIMVSQVPLSLSVGRQVVCFQMPLQIS